MPVPDSGPQIPFPYPPGLEPKAEAAPAKPAVAPFAAPSIADTAGPLSDAESEKSFVGDFLTRVFGGSHARDDEPEREEPIFEAPGLKGKAEKLAKATISDFASDKLKAPSLADALHADKPFMDQLTDSLESALAEVESLDDFDEAAERRAVQPMSFGDTAAAFPAGEDLPEEPPLVDTDIPYTNVQTSPAEHRAPAMAPQHMSAPAGPKAPPEPPHASHPDPIFDEQRTEAAPTTASQLPPGIEDSIKDMIKPLIVRWLNENLSRIVEQAVREELADRREDFSELRLGGGGNKR